ncbi:MAG: hypothetical protein IV100_11970 [Myxococcales bacterium]|nr:hypothetical protein [Myxococcales bacterium]
MPRPPLLCLVTLMVAAHPASSAPPPAHEPTVPPTEILGLTSRGALVFRRGATLFRCEAGAREAILVDAAPLGTLTGVHVGLTAPGGAAVVYPVQAPATAGSDRPADPAVVAPAEIIPDRPIRIARVDGDGDDVIGELQAQCPAPSVAPRPGRRRPAAAPVDSPQVTVGLDLHVAWTARDVVVIGTLTCDGESEPFLFTAPLRPAIADGAHHAVAATVEAESLRTLPMLQRVMALAALDPSSPRRLMSLAEAHALSGDTAAAVSTLWRLAALGPTARPALDQALSSAWVSTLQDRAAYRALVSSTMPTGNGDAGSPKGDAPASKDSP